MANYYGKGRTNAFRVKDFDAFVAAAAPFGQVYPEAHDRVIVLAHGEAGDFTAYDEENDKDTALSDILADHLRPGEIAILMSVGSQKHQFLEGWSMAVHSSGETIGLALSDIYREINETFPDCEYAEVSS